MKRDCIFHARRKIRYITPKNHINFGLTISKIKKPYDIGTRGGMTIYIKKDKDKLRWGFARCNIIDVYNKKVGVEYAQERAETSTIITDDMDFDNVVDLAKSVVEDINQYGFGRTNFKLLDIEKN